jgi:hypothetical protein
VIECGCRGVDEHQMWCGVHIASVMKDTYPAPTGLPFTDAELERFQETLRQGPTKMKGGFGTADHTKMVGTKRQQFTPTYPPCNLPVCDHSGGASRDCASMQYVPNSTLPYQDWCINCGSSPTSHDSQGNCSPLALGLSPMVPGVTYDLGNGLSITLDEGKPAEAEGSLCTANPSCGKPDEECPVCKAGNCPGAKCWRGCEVRR